MYSRQEFNLFANGLKFTWYFIWNLIYMGSFSQTSRGMPGGGYWVKPNVGVQEFGKRPQSQARTCWWVPLPFQARRLFLFRFLFFLNADHVFKPRRGPISMPLFFSSTSSHSMLHAPLHTHTHIPYKSWIPLLLPWGCSLENRGIRKWRLC